MPSKWFFTKNGKDRFGPYTTSQLCQLAASGQLTPSDMVLKESKGKWVRAGSIRGLFTPPSQAPPARQTVPAAGSEVEPADPASRELSAREYEETDQSRRTKGRTLALALLITGGVLLLVSFGLLMTFDMETRAETFLVICVLLVFMCVVGGAMWSILAIIGSTSSCPECGRWGAAVFVGSKVVGRKKCYGLVTRTAYTHSFGSTSGTAHPWVIGDNCLSS